MRKLSPTVGLFVGLLYAALYFFLAMGAAGAGHGTFIFFAAVGPYGLGLVVFPALGFLAGRLENFFPKVLFLSLLVIHYALVFNLLRLDWVNDSTYFRKTWDSHPWGVILPAGCYLLGQILIWVAFCRSLVAARKNMANDPDGLAV